MGQSTTETTTFKPCASLAALGYYLEHSKLFDPIRQQVQIMQKTVKHSPLDKLYLSGCLENPSIVDTHLANTTFLRAYGRPWSLPALSIVRAAWPVPHNLSSVGLEQRERASGQPVPGVSLGAPPRLMSPAIEPYFRLLRAAEPS
jgi:hypothetical protein